MHVTLTAVFFKPMDSKINVPGITINRISFLCAKQKKSKKCEQKVKPVSN